jgi:hypothetical protein
VELRKCWWKTAVSINSGYSHCRISILSCLINNLALMIWASRIGMADWICIVSLFDITLIDLKSPLSSSIYVDRFSVGHFNSTIIQTLQPYWPVACFYETMRFRSLGGL